MRQGLTGQPRLASHSWSYCLICPRIGLHIHATGPGKALLLLESVCRDAFSEGWGALWLLFLSVFLHSLPGLEGFAQHGIKKVIISKHREFLITKDDRNDGVRVSKIINVVTNSRYQCCLSRKGRWFTAAAWLLCSYYWGVFVCGISGGMLNAGNASLPLWTTPCKQWEHAAYR